MLRETFTSFLGENPSLKKKMALGLGTLAAVEGGAKIHEYNKEDEKMQAIIEQLVERVETREFSPLPKDSPIFEESDAQRNRIDTSTLFIDFQKEWEKLFVTSVPKDHGQNFEGLYIAYADQLEKFVNFYERYTNDLAEQTGRSTDQLHFVENVVRNGFYREQTPVAPKKIADRISETSEILKKNDPKNKDWYEEQFETVIGFADRMFGRVKNIEGAEREKIESGLSKYIKEELKVRAYIKLIADTSSRGRSEFVIKGIEAIGSEKGQPPILADLKNALKLSNSALEDLFDSLPKNSQFELEQLRAWQNANTWNQIQKILLSAPDNTQSVEELEKIKKEIDDALTLLDSYQKLDQAIRTGVAKLETTTPDRGAI